MNILGKLLCGVVLIRDRNECPQLHEQNSFGAEYRKKKKEKAVLKPQWFDVFPS